MSTSPQAGDDGLPQVKIFFYDCENDGGDGTSEPKRRVLTLTDEEWVAGAKGWNLLSSSGYFYSIFKPKVVSWNFWLYPATV